MIHTLLNHIVMCTAHLIRFSRHYDRTSASVLPWRRHFTFFYCCNCHEAKKRPLPNTEPFYPPRDSFTSPPSPKKTKKKTLYFITGADLRFKRWSAGQKWACGSQAGLCDADRRHDELRRHESKSQQREQTQWREKKSEKSPSRPLYSTPPQPFPPAR